MNQQGCDIGSIGLGTMGRNFVLNLADHGFAVAVYNRTAEKTKDFMDNEVGARPIQAGYDLKEFVGLLRRPRALILLVAAGEAVDAVHPELLPLLAPGDLAHRRRQLPFHRHQPARQFLAGQTALTLWAWGSPAAKPGPAMAPA